MADAGSGQVRFFDRAGAVGRIVGSRGRGPGEFTTLAGLGRGPSDRLWAYDFALRRISWIEPADGSIEIATLGPEPPVLTPVGPLDRTFVFRQLWGAARVARATRAGVWTRDGESASRWSVIDLRGSWLGDVTLPDGFRLLSVASDRLVGVERDEFDTEYVVVYRLLPGER